MSHNEVPVFLSKAIYMMHACHRLMEDRCPGLLQAADIKLDTVEFQLRTPPPKAAQRQDLDIDEASGNQTEAKVAEELHEENSNVEALAENSDAAPLAQEEGSDRNANNDSDSDVEPLAQDGDAEPAAKESDVESLAQEKESDGDVAPIDETGDKDELPNPAESADENLAASRLLPLYI